MVRSPCSPRGSQEFSPTPQFESSHYLLLSLLCGPTLTSVPETGKSIALTLWTFVGQVMSLLFKMLTWATLSLLHMWVACGCPCFWKLKVSWHFLVPATNRNHLSTLWHLSTIFAWNLIILNFSRSFSLPKHYRTDKAYFSELYFPDMSTIMSW